LILAILPLQGYFGMSTTSHDKEDVETYIRIMWKVPQQKNIKVCHSIMIVKNVTKQGERGKPLHKD
jgi:hypothetical protein